MTIKAGVKYRYCRKRSMHFKSVKEDMVQRYPGESKKEKRAILSGSSQCWR